MRLPKESELSREQKEVIFAPTEGTVLVVGPPGSGKTVVAIQRERALRKLDAEVQSLVFNKVLSRYTGNESTFLSWVAAWWRRCTKERFPYGQVMETNGRKWSEDFGQARQMAKTTQRGGLRARGHWGHLILDEAQDFAVDAHQFLFSVQHDVFGHIPEDARPSLCILADENQRLTSLNASLDEIRMSHLLSSNDVYELRRNYRNTREIATVAAHFYCGLPSGTPDPPERRGDKPRLIATVSLDDAVERIAQYARLHQDEEIGVLVSFNRTRNRLFNELQARLKNEFRVQTYTSDRDDPYSDPKKLVFDQPATITVLCYASAKGLEFDAVFLPELQSLDFDGGGRDRARMNLYVMCSRARKQLWLMVTDQERVSPIWSILPNNGELQEEVR